MTIHRHAQPRLIDELPELVDYIRAGLVEQGRADLVPEIEAAEVHDLDVRTHHAALDLMPRLDAKAMMSHPDRERIWIGAPKGVRRRSWAVTLDVIHGRTWLLAISHPSILRDPLRRLARRVANPASRDIRRR
jgi:hypothetical protein